MKMEINFGSRYTDLDNNVYKVVGNAFHYGDKADEVIFLAPIKNGTVGDVQYISRKEMEKGGILFPVSKYN